VSLSTLLLFAWSVAPASAEPPAEPLGNYRAENVKPSALPSEGAEPLHGKRSETTSTLSPDGEMPFEGPPRITPPTEGPHLQPDGVAPLDHRPGLRAGERKPPIAAPLGIEPPPPKPPPIDFKRLRMVRLDLVFGPMWRIRRVDTMVATSAEFGRIHGFSAAFHTAVIVDTQREVVRAIDVPIGFGAVARGKLRDRPLYGSVGLSAGILVHRAKTERGVIHRVDPDFRLPIRFAWTIATVGLSLVIEQGYSVRHRNYERRGVEVWARHAYRIGFAIGLHSDIPAGRATQRRSGHRQRGRRRV
jgi:hypothetical protein